MSLGDDSSYNIQGMGTIYLPLNNHACKIIEVLYVLGLRNNLLSISQFFITILKLNLINKMEKKCVSFETSLDAQKSLQEICGMRNVLAWCSPQQQQSSSSQWYRLSISLALMVWTPQYWILACNQQE